MHLYEINTEIESAITAMMDSVDEVTGEVSQEAVDKLTNLQMQRSEKLDNIGAYMKNLMADIKALKEEEKNLNSRRESKEGELEWFKAYVANNLNGESFESARVKFSFRKSEGVSIPDIELLDESYLITETTKKADTASIKEALKAGKEVRGAFLDKRNNLQIK